jgi:hypothetical protein
MHMHMHMHMHEKTYMLGNTQVPMVISGLTILSGMYASLENTRRGSVKVWHQPVTKNPNDPTTVVSLAFVCGSLSVCIVCA